MLRSRLMIGFMSSTLLLMGCAGLPSSSQSSSSSAVTIPEGEAYSDEDFATTLSTYVDDQGFVNYEELQKNREVLDRYNARIAAVKPEEYQAWSKPDQLAFLMNAYNSLTLQSIIDEDPLKPSIKDIWGVWNGRKFQVAGTDKTLDDIEHKTIRVDFNEPRIHASLVCAAMSCPPLRNEPYVGDQVDAQLDDQIKTWISRPDSGFRIDREENKVYLSKIFDWYGDDWKADYAIEGQYQGNSKQRAVLNFLSKYLSPEDQTYLKEGDYKIKYLGYDWKLNKQ